MRVSSQALGLPAHICYLIEKAAPLHDIGKIGIPDHIFLKQGKLTDMEWERMRNHAQMGADLLASHESLMVQLAASIALSHHEHWDGNGYPKQLRAASIPIEGRITAISDVLMRSRHKGHIKKRGRCRKQSNISRVKRERILILN